ncbi:MAG TPA: hypothetical protein VLH60_02260 [Sedimentisphaerales bacterium]|nr:hypothetical protein [Sedimentisphaerales bacterium]
MSVFKAQAVARELKQRLALQGLVVTESADAAKFPILSIVAAAEQLHVKIEMLPDPAAHVDGIGLPQRLYSPHMATLIESILPSGALPADQTASLIVRERVFAAVAKLGMKIALRVIDGAVSPDYATALAASALATEIRSDEIHGLTMSQ